MRRHTQDVMSKQNKSIVFRWPETNADDSGARRERSKERHGRAREEDGSPEVAGTEELPRGGDGPEEPSAVHGRSASKAN